MISAGAPVEYKPFGRSLLALHNQDTGFNSNENPSSWFSAETEVSRDLFKALKSFSLKDSFQHEKWYLRKCDEGEEELYFSENTVVWSKSDGYGTSHLIKTFSMSSKVLEAVWCSFKDGSQDFDAICIISDTNLEIFSQHGHQFPVSLPFQVSRIIPTKNGLLLERLAQNNETSLPLLFSLTHPLKEIAPIIVKYLKKPNLKYLTTENNVKLISHCIANSLVTFYHKSEGIHSVWILRSATQEEVISSESCNYDSTTLSSDSLFILSSRQASSQSTLMASNTSSPFRSTNAIKQSSITSPNATRNASSSASSSAFISPLRSSRLGASPSGSPLLRGYCSPTGQTFLNQSPQEISKTKNGDSKSFTPTSRNLDLLADTVIEPIFPEICLEQIWIEPHHSTSGQASKTFVTCDLTGQNYLALLLPQKQQLKLIRFDKSNDGKKLIFGTINLIIAKDAEPIQSMKMILIVENNGSLMLYSGLHKVSPVHLPSIISPTLSLPINKSIQSPSGKRSTLITSSRPASAVGFDPRFSLEDQLLSPVINDSCHSSFTDNNLSQSSYVSICSVVSVQDSVENRVTVESSESIYFRFLMPQISSSQVVELCLNSFKTVLPRDINMNLMVKWYSVRNSPGPNEFTGLSEFKLFLYCLLKLCGYDTDSLPINVGFDMITLSDFSPNVVKKLKLDADESGTDEDWNYIMNPNESSKDTEECLAILNTSAVLFQNLPYVFYTLHVIYEEMKLHSLMWEFLPELSKILYILAVDLRLISYQDFYWKEYPEICSKVRTTPKIDENESKNLLYPHYFTETPPSIYGFLQALLRSQNVHASAFPFIPHATNNIKITILLFLSLKLKKFIQKDYLISIGYLKSTQEEQFSIEKNILPEQRLIENMIELGVNLKYLEQLPYGLIIPLWDAIFICRENPLPEWSEECYRLIGREDMMLLASKSSKSSVKKEISDAEQDEDGISSLDHEVLKLLFPEDQRIFEAYNMVQSSKPVPISLAQRPGVSDHDFIEEQERHLYTLSIRTMALPLGRGMLTLRTCKPVVAEPFPIPKLCLTGKVPPRNTTVELSHIEIPANMNTWPLYHNGVAAGLRVCTSASEVIESTWILYNRPKISSSGTADALNEHAGFLLALGLNGHLTKLSMLNIHDYLSKGNELTRVSVLLGMAAAKKGTMDISATKVLSIHVEALLPPTSTELDVPPIVQVAAVLGVGLIYQKSGQHHIAEVLLGEIGRPPGPEMEHHIDRESYALSAGLAFGLVTLGRGNDMTSLVASSESVSMADQLCNYMVGGHKKPLTTVQKEKYKTPSYQIREGDYVNADVTSPGATLALGMMFFDSNNDHVANWVTAPDTQHLLETVRPDFLLLRTLSKGLITWSNIKPTKEWIDSHVPLIVAENAFKRHLDFNPRIDYETMSQAYCNIIAGACFALGLKFAGSANNDAFETIMGFTKLFISLPNKPAFADQAGRSTIESCLNVMVIALAMIMTGTGNIEVLKICRYLRSRLSQANVVLYGSHMALHMALGLLFLGGCRYTLSSSPESIAALIIAFFPKFPIHSNDNRYHLQAFRHLYVLAVEPRLVIPRDVTTGKFGYINLRIRFKDSKKSCILKAPCFLLELNLIDEVLVDDKRYWNIVFKEFKNWDTLRSFLEKDGILHVKQKVGCLPYKDDPKGYKSLHAQRIIKDAIHGWSYQPSTIVAFSNDPVVINFSNYLLTPKANIPEEALMQNKLFVELLDCVFNERLELLSPIIKLFTSLCGHSKNLNSLMLWQIKLTISVAPNCKSLRSDFIETLKIKTEEYFQGISKLHLIQYLKGAINLNELPESTAQVLLFNDMPPYGSLSPLWPVQGHMSFTDLLLNLNHFNMPMSTLIMLSNLLSQD